MSELKRLKEGYCKGCNNFSDKIGCTIFLNNKNSGAWFAMCHGIIEAYGGTPNDIAVERSGLNTQVKLLKNKLAEYEGGTEMIVNKHKGSK